MRLVSVLAGTAIIPLSFVLGRWTVGVRAGVVAAALVALGPFMIYYSTEARPYALLILLVLLSTLSLLRALSSERSRWWVAYAVFACAAAYTHFTSRVRARRPVRVGLAGAAGRAATARAGQCRGRDRLPSVAAGLDQDHPLPGHGALSSPGSVLPALDEDRLRPLGDRASLPADLASSGRPGGRCGRARGGYGSARRSACPRPAPGAPRAAASNVSASAGDRARGGCAGRGRALQRRCARAFGGRATSSRRGPATASCSGRWSAIRRGSGA